MTRFKPIKRVLVVYKQSAYDVALPHLSGSARGRLGPLLKKYQVAHQEHEDTKRVVRAVLAKSGVNFRFTKRRQLIKPGNYDVIITLGGDGTVLLVSHQVTVTPILAVNSSPSLSVGALCELTSKNFAEHWPRLSRGNYRISERQRLQVRLNEKKIKTLALNDVLYANRWSGGTSRYILRVGRLEEEQVSSGIWVATASGSTGVIRSAGGKTCPPSSKLIQYLVREPYQVKRSYSLKRGVLPALQSIKIINHTLSAALFIDGHEVDIPLKLGDRIGLSLARRPLKLVSFRTDS